MSKNSRFITIEGVDGAGKSSHVQSIYEYFIAQGFNVTLTREPGGCELGEKLREILLNDHMDPVTETMLMFAARKEHLQTVILPALEKGNIVVCDRFTDSTYAYQAGGKNVSESILSSLENMTHPDLQPGLTFLFDLPVEVSLARLAKTGKIPDKFESAGAKFFTDVRNTYKLRAQDPRFRVIDSTQSIDKCKADVLENLNNYLPNLKSSLKKKSHP